MRTLSDELFGVRRQTEVMEMKVFEILAALSLSYLFINALSEIKHRLKKSLPGAKQTNSGLHI
jgi:hypothetical protein